VAMAMTRSKWRTRSLLALVAATSSKVPMLLLGAGATAGDTVGRLAVAS
jgi:hypothetical protein